MAPVSYALVAKKAAGTSEENDSPNTMSEMPTNAGDQAGNSAKSEKKKRNRKAQKLKKAVSRYFELYLVCYFRVNDSFLYNKFQVV